MLCQNNLNNFCRFSWDKKSGNGYLAISAIWFDFCHLIIFQWKGNPETSECLSKTINWSRKTEKKKMHKICRNIIYMRLSWENNLRLWNNKPLSGLLVYWRIMPLPERLSSKFHSSPHSFASLPTVHFSDNLSALGIILQYTSCWKEFIY